MPTFFLCILTLLLSCFADSSRADEASVDQPAQVEEQAQEMMVYGSQLMTPEERAAYRARWCAATTDEERQKIRAEHHDEMQKRAAAQGVTLPEAPPAQGMGMGPGMGCGRGMGKGLGYGRNR